MQPLLPSPMVRITVDSFKDKDSLAIYEVAEGSSIIDLKAEIEATENIPVGHQRLVYEEQELQDNEKIDPLKTTIYLLKAQIHLYLKQRNATNSQDEIIDVPIDLEEPVRNLSKLIQRDGKTIDASSAKLFVLDSDKQPTTSITDVDHSFSSYGVYNGSTIDVIYESWSKAETDFDRLHGFPRRGPETTRKIVRAKHDWDGEMMHPIIKGLPLKINDLFNAIAVSDGFAPPGWLYGSPIHQPEPKPTWFLFLFRRDKEKEKAVDEGFFPENFVSAVGETAEKHLEATDTLKTPPLPPFRFPPATGMSFHMPFSDNGHSFLKLTVNYELTTCPTDPTRVTIALLCSTHDIRRISSVSMFITIPLSAISDIRVCDNEAHRKEIQTDKEVTDNQSKQTHFDGVNVGAHGVTVGVQGGVSRKRSIGSTEKGSKVSQRKVEAGMLKENTIFWNLKAPMTKLDDEGLNGVESITFILEKKPVEFKYECRVTHSRNGIEKTTERVSKT